MYGPMQDMTSEEGDKPHMCFCLTHDELPKLDMDDSPEIGDYLHAEIVARVCAVTKMEDPEGGPPRCRIEFCIEGMRANEASHERAGDDTPIDQRLGSALYG